MTKNKRVEVRHLGMMDYQDAWDYQKKLFHEVIDQKLKKREDETVLTSNYLLICEHPPTYTLGKSGKKDHLLVNEEYLKNIGASFVEIERGGDITFHGPGQLVAYPILDLDNFFTDIHLFMRKLEETVIQTLQKLDLHAGREEGLTGVWVPQEGSISRKICAMGVKLSRWVSMHGLALNVHTDLSYFNHIVPCGIADKPVTSIFEERGIIYPIEDVASTLEKEFSIQFNAELI